MFAIGDKIIVKDLKSLVDDGLLTLSNDLKDVYYNKNNNFVIFPDFPFFNTECVIDDVDKRDKDIPYFLSIGIWVPEFMIKKVEEPEKIVAIEDENEDKEPKKVWINKFNNKPFGKIFVKLINLDEKISEFSDTAFSRLKKHELQYIAKLLIDHGQEAIDLNKSTQKELAVYCYNKTLAL